MGQNTGPRRERSAGGGVLAPTGGVRASAGAVGGRFQLPAFCFGLPRIAKRITPGAVSGGRRFAVAVASGLQQKTGGRRRFSAVSPSRNRKIEGGHRVLHGRLYAVSAMQLVGVNRF